MEIQVINGSSGKILFAYESEIKPDVGEIIHIVAKKEERFIVNAVAHRLNYGMQERLKHTVMDIVVQRLEK